MSLFIIQTQTKQEKAGAKSSFPSSMENWSTFELPEKVEILNILSLTWTTTNIIILMMMTGIMMMLINDDDSDYDDDN